MNITCSVDLVRAARRSETIPQSWTDTTLAREIDRYMRFLKLAQANPNTPLAPTRSIDLLWHLHMLHPRAYQADCMRVFGCILDHDGGFGADPAELPELQATFARTAELWEQQFGEPYVAQADDPRMTNCWHDCQGRCWHACKGGNDDDDERSPNRTPAIQA